LKKLNHEKKLIKSIKIFKKYLVWFWFRKIKIKKSNRIKKIKNQTEKIQTKPKSSPLKSKKKNLKKQYSFLFLI
jgi:hypothetical protein